jgi:NTE family protein
MTDVTRAVFSYQTTPHMEVALAVRASMSVPLLFSPVLLEGKAGESLTHFADGGMLANYPVDFFDKFCSFEETLGANFQTTPYNKEIKTLVDYMGQFLACNTRLQDMIYQTPENKKRTIFIPVGALNPLDFEVDLHGVIYNFLYIQGYESAKKYFMAH